MIVPACYHSAAVLLLLLWFMAGCGKHPPAPVRVEEIIAEKLTADSGETEAISTRNLAHINEPVHISCRFRSDGRMPEKLLVRILRENRGEKPTTVQSGSLEVIHLSGNEYEMSGTLRPVRKSGDYLLAASYRGQVVAESTLEVRE